MDAIFIPHFGFFQRLLIFCNGRLIVRVHPGKQCRLLVAHRRRELLPEGLGILHRLISVREMWLRQFRSLDRLFRRLPRRFDVRLLLRELLRLAAEWEQRPEKQRQCPGFQMPSDHENSPFSCDKVPVRIISQPALAGYRSVVGFEGLKETTILRANAILFPVAFLSVLPLVSFSERGDLHLHFG